MHHAVTTPLQDVGRCDSQSKFRTALDTLETLCCQGLQIANNVCKCITSVPSTGSNNMWRHGHDSRGRKRLSTMHVTWARPCKVVRSACNVMGQAAHRLM